MAVRGPSGARLAPESTLATAEVRDGTILTVTDVPAPAPLTFRVADAAGHFLELRAKNTIKVRYVVVLADAAVTTSKRMCSLMTDYDLFVCNLLLLFVVLLVLLVIVVIVIVVLVVVGQPRFNNAQVSKVLNGWCSNAPDTRAPTDDVVLLSPTTGLPMHPKFTLGEYNVTDGAQLLVVNRAEASKHIAAAKAGGLAVGAEHTYDRPPRLPTDISSSSGTGTLHSSTDSPAPPDDAEDSLGTPPEEAPPPPETGTSGRTVSLNFSVSSLSCVLSSE